VHQMDRIYAIVTHGTNVPVISVAMVTRNISLGRSVASAFVGFIATRADRQADTSVSPDSATVSMIRTHQYLSTSDLSIPLYSRLNASDIGDDPEGCHCKR
jgi:hypothetical protein